MKLFLLSCLSALLSLAASDSQNITVQSSLQIPGGILAPGQYTISLEDRMRGRAIIRVENAEKSEHHLLLAVPDGKIAASAGAQIVFFDSASSGKQILRAWTCPSCDTPLEVVYPKLEAAQITADTGQSVLAADPAFDRLPANLSADDMKVVTLWLLSPERVTHHHGVGLTAVKYSQSTDAAEVSNRETLPQTASGTYSFAAAGILFLVASFALYFQEKRRQPCRA